MAGFFEVKPNQQTKTFVMSKEIFKKPAKGWAHLYLETSGAQKALIEIGPSLAQKLSAFLGRVPVTPMVIECRSNPGCYRLLFNVPPGTKLPQGAQTLTVTGKEKVTRVVTFPLEAISRNLAKVTKAFEPFFWEATLSPDGEEMVVLFGESQQLVKNVRIAAKRLGLTVRGLSERKPGELEKAIYLVAQLQKPKTPAKASKPKPKRKAKKKPVKVRTIRKKPELASPDSVRLLLSSLTSRQKDLIISKLAQMHPGQFLSLVKESAPSNVASPGPKPKREGGYSDIKLEEPSLS